MKPVPSDCLTAHFSIFPLSYNFVVTDFALHEYIGILRYHDNLLGWTAKASSAGYP